MKSCRTIFAIAFALGVFIACGRGGAPASPTVVDIASADVSNAAPHTNIADAGALGEMKNDAGDAPFAALGHGTRVTIRGMAFTVNGPLPRDAIQRIVRQGFGRFRGCYEDGLKSTPGLVGKVTTHFVIDSSGRVASVKDNGSDLPDPAVVACVVRAFGDLWFPGSPTDVTVSYPLLFFTEPY